MKNPAKMFLLVVMAIVVLTFSCYRYEKVRGTNLIDGSVPCPETKIRWRHQKRDCKNGY